MTGSPLVARPSSALNPSLMSPVPSPFKQQQLGSPSRFSSSNATPKLAGAAPTAPSSSDLAARLPQTLDLSEQMNEVEKKKYIKGKRLGEGTYAVVFLGHLRSDPTQRVAIKKIKVQKEYTDGLPPDAVREIKFLQELKHPNIISLLSVFSSKDQNLNLVLEYLPLGDLEMLIRDTNAVRYGAGDIKAWMGMLTRAVWFCHENFVLHRDIKPNNLLISASGDIKLADFGLARSFADPHQYMTCQVITRWYRPPELLFAVKHYGGGADVWSVGCVFAELILRAPYLPGDTDIHQLALICRELGTPTEENWPGVTRQKEYHAIPSEIYPVKPREYFQGRFGTVGGAGVDLLMRTLTLDPKKRISAREMLQHEWWFAEPRPTPKQDLPTKAEAPQVAAADIKRRPGAAGKEDDDEPNRGAKVARRLDFGNMR
ncbi:TFIIH complex serine/threonine-protein kinase subunit kin28 [Ceratocystis pirilliformis]|uniref:TFIIH complex serine/threonine-protein kinase subunit kin28 n=1 Tax=Ceratocystis pirilliformis TaxID=259994 RepID=A0ABR3ZHN0_9PEZI